MTLIVHDPFYHFSSPTWSPDSSQLAFLLMGNIFVWDIQDDTYPKLLFDLSASILAEADPWCVDNLAWSPDGTEFAFSDCYNRMYLASISENSLTLLKENAGAVIGWLNISQ